MTSVCAPIMLASRAEARSLSMTASTPASDPSSRRTTGMPPPPTATAITSRSSSARIASHSTTSRGCGLGTTRRQPRPESSTTAHPSSRRNCSARSAS